MTIEHPFAQYVRILGKGRKGSRSLTFAEALAAMTMILNGECEDVQLGAFMMLLRVKEENAEELAGFTQAAKNHIQASIPKIIKADLDWSSYAGKRRQLPWYILSCLTLADNGIKIFMHGANAHTANRIYTQDALNHLNIATANNWQDAQAMLSNNNFCYMDMGTLCPELQRIIDLRNIFGLRSPVHSFARLLNPLNCEFVSQGIFHPGYGPSHQQSAELLNYSRLSILKGEGGECECNPDAPFKMHHCFDGQLTEEQWPPIFERRHVRPDTLNLDDLQKVWEGTLEDEYALGAILGTLAYVARLMGQAESQQDCLEQARHWWQQRNKSRFNQ